VLINYTKLFSWFREVYKSRQEVMAQWEAAVRLLSKRDAEIEGVALEIER
jgi:hypothetical protein